MHYSWKQWIPVMVGIVGIIVLAIAMPYAVKYVGKASGTPANILIDYQGVLGQMPTPWRNLAQGGEEPKEMLSGVVSEVKALRPEYIRLDHLYDGYQVVSESGGQLTYDWSRLDNAVNQILATGAKPFLSLSYMPTAISKGDIIDQPKDWNQWAAVVRATIEHYSGRGNKNIGGVIYEVWNEPDLFGSYKTYGDKNYLTMYQYAAQGAARATGVDQFEFGGPAITALYQNWAENMIKFVDKNNLRMDFFSWHRYDYNLERFEQDADQIREWSSNIPALVNLKFYVTEWGHDPKNQDGYDTKFGAIHTLAAARTMMAKVQRAFVFEIKDGPGNEKFWGRWGLLTHEKFGTPEKKPRYYALQFLNSLGRFRVSLAGEGSWVKGIASTDEAGNMKVMVVNYDPKGQHSEAVPITFDNLPKTTFKFVRKDFSGSTTTINVATDSASWKTTEFMGANSAAMFSLEF